MSAHLTILRCYLHTLRYLRSEQVFGRLRARLSRPKPDLFAPPERREQQVAWVAAALRSPSLLGPDYMRFLNEERNVGAATAWNDAQCEKLWVYNLHYFDDLNARGFQERKAWHVGLITRWVRENPPGEGTGWEPYPTSLRIVNWIKWALQGNALREDWHHSLAVQIRWLSRRLEWHLLGNHLFANAKALVFAGVYFEGAEAEAWLVKGLRILERELPEQILPDGGQFERSTMYHALALEDVLDLINLFAAFPDVVLGQWHSLATVLPETAGRMRRWLGAMCHPDGEIALFNDAALGIAPCRAELDAYAVRLGLGVASDWPDGLSPLPDSGYLRVQQKDYVALLDIAPIGPDYLPGHAHADTLSFELSLFGRRVFVNSGTSIYGTGPERLRQRGTAAHNTVTIDGADSSEVWGGFRVARRAKPFGLKIDERDGELAISCAQDGYQRLPGRPVHRRTWRFGDAWLAITDMIEGPFQEGIARYFLHPEVALQEGEQSLNVPGFAGRICWRVEGGLARIVPSTYHPEFGVSLPSHCIEVKLLTDRCELVLNWT